MSGRYCSVCGEMDYSDLGDMPCACADLEQQRPEPTVEEQCVAEGHP